MTLYVSAHNKPTVLTACQGTLASHLPRPREQHSLHCTCNQRNLSDSLSFTLFAACSARRMSAAILSCFTLTALQGYVAVLRLLFNHVKEGGTALFEGLVTPRLP